ncbi:hypothetical protein V8E51_004123 [Hyaloscypha variabilis]
MVSQGISFLSLLVMATCILAAPKTYPEVIPGPGLPSLASLNLTSAELYEMDYHTILSEFNRREETSILEAQFNLNCDGQKCQATDAVACINYLAKLGSKTCTMNFNNNLHQALLCTSNSARILAHQIEPNQVSSCEDVARGGGKIMDGCTKFGLVSGQDAAWGNGDYIVDIALEGTDE